jgi:hypothetical protein
LTVDANIAAGPQGGIDDTLGFPGKAPVGDTAVSISQMEPRGQHFKSASTIEVL